MSHINRSVFPQLKMTYYSVCDFLMKAVLSFSLAKRLHLYWEKLFSCKIWCFGGGNAKNWYSESTSTSLAKESLVETPPPHFCIIQSHTSITKSIWCVSPCSEYFPRWGQKSHSHIRLYGQRPRKVWREWWKRAGWGSASRWPSSPWSCPELCTALWAPQLHYVSENQTEL